MGLRNTLSSGLPVSSLARSSPVTALKSPWRPLGDQAPLRAKEVLRGSFQSLAYRMGKGSQKLDVGKSGGLSMGLLSPGPVEGAPQQYSH